MFIYLYETISGDFYSDVLDLRKQGFSESKVGTCVALEGIVFFNIRRKIYSFMCAIAFNERGKAKFESMIKPKKTIFHT